MKVTELLAIHLKSSKVEGLNINGQKILINQLADDTTLFLKNKTKRIYGGPETSLYNFGTLITKSLDSSNKLNFENTIVKNKKNLNNKLQRDMTAPTTKPVKE